MSSIATLALALPCDTCAAMPGQPCRKKAGGQTLHTARRIAAARSVGWRIEAVAK